MIEREKIAQNSHAEREKVRLSKLKNARFLPKRWFIYIKRHNKHRASAKIKRFEKLKIF